ncbi:MAG: DUF1049 domain-containing protein [Deltaproteobacteria bacterium]|nr:DUF1049 domain-containing protein [Deltaproteobacteria bacterium]MBI2501253.1 DUF1049 domain-containing protein [Deltaproteobacteria bacterium]MBI4196964.1 DUF1049 domain-containing protein [Deltaproteobacteria bacterium]
MIKLIYSLTLAFLTFVILNFFYSNVGGEAFQHLLTFQFRIPHLLTLESYPIPVGFLLIATFCLGMIFLPLLQILPRVFRSTELRHKEKKIRELQKELEEARMSSLAMRDPDHEASSSSNP